MHPAPFERTHTLTPSSSAETLCLVLLRALQEPWRFPAWWQCQDSTIPVTLCCPLEDTLHLSYG